jgi:tetratricopeptide (TPR) repeat protein
MTTDQSAPASPALESGALLEQDKRLSDSVLWTIMRQYYNDHGPAAWHSGDVPSYATCNTYIAQAYANVIIAYLRDARAAGLIDPGQPIYIVELAAGVGRFAFQLLNKLHELKQASSVKALDLRYVMTDFTPTNIKVWSRHPHLQPFVQAGVLDFGTFDAERSREIALVSGGTLSAATVKNPLIVLGNYAFDTFRHDLFKIAGGLHEVTVTTRAPGPHAPDLSKTEIAAKLQIQYGSRPIGDAYYDDPLLNQILAGYRERLADVTIGFPIGGLTALRRLIEIAHGKLFLLSSDKGFTHEDELYHPGQQSMQFHAGAFSMMVNYHAIGEYFVAQGGHYMATSRRFMNLKTAACVLGGEAEQFADTISMFRERVDNFGPGEFFELLQQQRQDRRQISVEQFLGLLRLSHWDPGLVWDYAAQLRGQAGNLTEGLQLELRLALERAWRNYFPGPQNLPFELARILMSLRRPLEAIRFNQLSIDWFGEQPSTYLNMGICHYYSEQPDQALTCFARARELNPEFGLAREWTARILAERARSAAGAPPPLAHVPTAAPAPTDPPRPS